VTSHDAVAAASRSAHPRRRQRVRLAAFMRHVLLVVACGLALYPIFFMVTTAFKTRADYLANPYSLPWPISFGNFSQAVDGGAFGTWFKNSVILTLGSVILSTAFAALAAFAVARMRWRGRHVFLSVNVALMVVPPVVMLIPLFIFFTDLHLVSTYQGVILIYAGLTLPFSVYLLTNFFRSIPHELVESALVDGSGNLGILLRIVLPLSVPALVTLVVVNALWVWNELLIALVFLQDDDRRTLTAGLTFFQGRFVSNEPLVMTGALIATVPMLLLYIAGQRYFVRGLTAGFGK